MSVNCIQCITAQRTGSDLLCDSCRRVAQAHGLTPHDVLAMQGLASELRKVRAQTKPFESPHHAYGALLEEVDEFWEEARKKPDQRDPKAMARELIQVAAVALRAAVDLGGIE